MNDMDTSDNKSVFMSCETVGSRYGAAIVHTMLASVTIHVCTVLYHAGTRITKWISIRFCERFPLANTLKYVSEDHPQVVGNVFSGQISFWTLTSLAISSCFITNVLRSPFVDTSRAEFITFLFSFNIGRYMHKIGQAFVTNVHKTKFWWAHVLHHFITVMCYIIMIVWRENLIMGIIGIFMEADHLCLDIKSIIRKCEYKKHQTVYLVTTLALCCTSATCRLVAPILLLVVSVYAQNPLQMSPVSLAGFFFGITFSLIVNIWVIRVAIMSLMDCHRERGKETLRKALSRKSSGRPSTLNNSENVFTENEMNYLRPVRNTNIACGEDTEKMTKVSEKVSIDAQLRYSDLSIVK